MEVKPLAEAGLRLGARYRVTQPNLRPAVYEVSECVPREVFTWVQKFPGGGMVAGHRIAVRNGQTEVELSFCSKGLLAGIISQMFSKTIRNYVATEASSLKRAAEAQCLTPDT